MDVQECDFENCAVEYDVLDSCLVHIDGHAIEPTTKEVKENAVSELMFQR